MSIYDGLVWHDEPCDRTEGHIGVYQKYEELTGEKLRIENAVLIEEDEPDITWTMKDYIVVFCPDGHYIYHKV